MFIDIPSHQIQIKGGQLKSKKTCFLLSCELDEKNIEISLLTSKPGHDATLQYEFSTSMDALHGMIDIQKLAKAITEHEDEVASTDVLATLLITGKVISLVFQLTDDDIQLVTLTLSTGKPKGKPMILEGVENDFSDDWRDFFRITK